MSTDLSREENSAEIRRTLAHNIRVARRARGFTQGALAEGSGLTALAISRLERGLTEPRISSLLAIAEALGAPLLDLLAGLMDPPARPGCLCSARTVRPMKNQ
ncbi:MAG: helix-turn-helix domain-containing protein [Solirubrobacteraceae bacterium]|jgi:XRE family transcriptional regulator, fatty acid utilization regulator